MVRRPLSEIRLRDPFLLPDPATGLYYLVTSNLRPEGRGRGVSMLTSPDLETWEGPVSVFDIPSDFWAQGEVWAPEMHRYAGRCYLFATFCEEVPFATLCANWPSAVRRGTQVLVADTPFGPFIPFHNRAHTPFERMTLDGTLWVEEGIPYLIYCHEWVQIDNGTMECVRLKGDLSESVGASTTLFRGSDAPYARPNQERYVTDGPFLHRTASGTLLMLWSSFGAKGYATGLARSRSNRLHGPWEQLPDPLFETDGGHAMIFRTFEGRLMLALHQPNQFPDERAHLFELEDRGDRLAIRQSPDRKRPMRAGV